MREEALTDTARILEILRQAKALAQEYRALTGKPLGITCEVAEYEAHNILGVKLLPARHPGCDATEEVDGATRRLQIKGRVVFPGTRPGRLGKINVKEAWDAVLFVRLDENFDAVEIYEAGRQAVLAALSAPGSKARNERGALSVAKFMQIGTLRWQRAGTPNEHHNASAS